MHTESTLPARHDGRAVDLWAFLAGGSMGIVIGFAIDLARLGVYKARQALAARAARRRAAPAWPSRETCDACPR